MVLITLKMKDIKFKINNLDLIKIIFTLILILVFTLPIVFFGIMDLEDYNYGFFFFLYNWY